MPALVNPGLEFTKWLQFDGHDGKHIATAGEPPIENRMEAYRYLRGRRRVIEESARQRPLIRLADKNMNLISVIANEKSASIEELAADAGQGNVVLRGDNWVNEYIIEQTRLHEDLHLIVDPIPTKTNWRRRWGGKITGVNAKRDSSGLHTVELEAISNRQHAKHLLFGANPIFPPEVQLPKMWVLPGNTRSILHLSMFINLARLFFPVLSIPTNIFNPAGWLNGGIAGLDPLAWPLQVQFINPLLDQSRTSVIASTWTDWHAAAGDIMKDAGCDLRAYTWLEEDEDSPHVELTALARLFGNQVGGAVDHLVRPTRNCVVFAVEDKSGHVGPSGTALDGLFNLITATADDLLSPILVNLDTGETLDGMPIEEASGEDRSTIIERLTGAAAEKPKTIWYEGQYTGVIEAEQRQHKAPVMTAMTGGRSPQIVNQAQTFAIRYALAQLAQSIALVGQAPGSEGIENLYQGQLDNTLFAWMRHTDPVRRAFTGDFAFQEHMERGGGTAYTLSGIITLRLGIFNTRAWQGFKTSVINGRPHFIDEDVFLGDRAGFEHRGIIWVDQITAVKRAWDRNTPVTVSLAIGDDSDTEDPAARGIRALAAAWSVLGMFLGEGTIF